MKKDPLLYNKIFGAILVTILIIYGADSLGHTVLSKNDVTIGASGTASNAPSESTASASTGAAQAATLEVAAISPLLASADAARGEALFKRACASCHATAAGVNKVGPSLWNVVGRDVASENGFRYSKVMEGLAGAWDYEKINQLIYKPAAFLRGTKMSYAGMKSDAERADVIAYLRSLADSPAALP